MKTLEDLIASSHVAGGIVFESEVLKEATDSVIEEKRKTAVTVCKGLIQTFDGILTSNVKLLRTYREAEKNQKDNVDKIDKAYRHFAKTGNPLPFFKVSGRSAEATYFCQQLKIDVPAANDSAWNVGE